MTLAQYPEVTVIRLPQNLGYCMAYNLAMPYAFADGCDWVVWANSDILLEVGCLQELALAAQNDPRIGILGPAFLAWDSDDPNYYMRGKHPEAIPAMTKGDAGVIDVDWVEGSFLMVSRRCVEIVGPMDPFFFAYWEEADFCRRARLHGWRVVLLPRALARHYGGGSSLEQVREKNLANYLQARNFYIYTLTDPRMAFGRNVIASFHLLLVNLKQSFSHSRSSTSFHLRVAMHILKEIRPIYKKWVRDRKGGHPALTAEEYSSLQAQVVLRESVEKQVA